MQRPPNLTPNNPALVAILAAMLGVLHARALSTSLGCDPPDAVTPQTL